MWNRCLSYLLAGNCGALVAIWQSAEAAWEERVCMRAALAWKSTVAIRTCVGPGHRKASREGYSQADQMLRTSLSNTDLSPVLEALWHPDAWSNSLPLA